MKTIEEIMGLIEDYAELSCKLGFRNLTPYEYSCKAEEKSKEIESALRELVERKPLSDDGIKKHIGVERGSPSFVVLEAVVRATENAHGIGA